MAYREIHITYTTEKYPLLTEKYIRLTEKYALFTPQRYTYGLQRNTVLPIANWQNLSSNSLILFFFVTKTFVSTVSCDAFQQLKNTSVGVICYVPQGTMVF